MLAFWTLSVVSCGMTRFSFSKTSCVTWRWERRQWMRPSCVGGNWLPRSSNDIVPGRRVHPSAIHGKASLGPAAAQFAVTIMSAIVVSGFVSLTLTPMLSAVSLQPPHNKHGRLFNFFYGSRRVTNAYDRCRHVVFGINLATISASALLLSVTAYLYTSSRKSFLPY